MKTERLLILGMAIAMLVMSYKIGALSHGGSADSASNGSKKDTVLSVIHNRKSVRVFTDQKVSKGDLDTIMRAGMAAPTGFDARPWQFVAITDRDIMMELRKELGYAKGLDTSTAAIVVCGDMKKADPRALEFWITDTCAATENMLLAIEAMDLGGVWCTLYPGEERMTHARKVLNLPEHIMPMCVIPVGYPAGENSPKDKLKILKHTRKCITVGLFAAMWLEASTSIAGYEPFSAFLFQHASTAVLIIAGLSLIISLFTPKPWCRFACPTGEMLKWTDKLSN